jgi:Ni/Fe-hydrogenase subunit HybB-like protein
MLGASGMGIFVVLSMKNREKETKFAASYYGKMIISSSLVLALLLFWAMLSAYFDPEAWASFSQMLKGSYSAMFWCAGVLGFLISPTVAGIAVRRKNTTAIVASSIMSLLFGFTILYLIVVVPQTVYFDVLAGVVNERVYSIGELLIAVGGLLIWLSLISLGYLLLPLLPEERAKKLLIFK